MVFSNNNNNVEHTTNLKLLFVYLIFLRTVNCANHKYVLLYWLSLIDIMSLNILILCFNII